jgi:serine/threonine protein kinase
MATKPLDEEAIFHVARCIPSAEDRAKFIGRACSADAALAERVQALLDEYECDPDFHKALRPAETATYEPVAERAGTRVGPYRLMEQIGEGGFGLVFVAEQMEPVKRKVAVKIIKPGMDSAQVIARFEAERQALALMDHPNIARVLDAGATESGRPYFVMELVRGIPITDYCDQNQLTARERLELYVTVCHAIQHAHQKGVIHRDIKPSNVLVTSHDGKSVAKVIDFGVAKAIHQQLTERTIYTQFAQMIGTPLYMSPEQAEMSGLDIDTRSDIYSLGVLLYELLTGVTPLDKKRLAQAAYDEIRRMIREEEPPKPSTRLSATESIASIAAQRRTEPAKLSKLIRGDLDWITMKALEKDRTRRYESANGLARDIQRYLADEVIEARPPSTGYRLGKFVKKNRVALTTAAAVALLLVAGVLANTWEAVRAMRAERAAQRSATEAIAAQQAEVQQRRLAESAALAEKTAKERAEAREAETKSILDFVENKVFAAARPKDQEGGLGHDVKLADAVKSALPFVEESFAEQPLIEARLRMTMGRSFWFLGDAKTAIEQFQSARTLFTKQLGSDHPYTLTSMNNLAESYFYAGRTGEATKLHEETLWLRKATLGSDHPYTLRSMNNLATSYDAVGRTQEALKLREEAVRLTKAKLGAGHLDTLMSMGNLAESFRNAGRTQEATRLHEETLQLIKAKLGPEHPYTLTSMGNLANSYAAAGRIQEATNLHEETLQLMQAKLGPDHPDTLGGMNNLAECYRNAGRIQEATKVHEEMLQLTKAKLGPDHPNTLLSMNNLAGSYATLGRYADALKLCRQVTVLWEKLNRTDSLSLYNAACFRAVAAAVLRKADESSEGAREANAEADRAMAWLKQAVAAGWKDDDQMKKNDDLTALRERDDFKKLLTELEGGKQYIK